MNRPVAPRSPSIWTPPRHRVVLWPCPPPLSIGVHYCIALAGIFVSPAVSRRGRRGRRVRCRGGRRGCARITGDSGICSGRDSPPASHVQEQRAIASPPPSPPRARTRCAAKSACAVGSPAKQSNVRNAYLTGVTRLARRGRMREDIVFLILTGKLRSSPCNVCCFCVCRVFTFTLSFAMIWWHLYFLTHVCGYED